MKWILTLLFVVHLSGCFSVKQASNNNHVYFVPALHGYHAINNNYSYDSLKAIIRRIDPDIIAVEIRPEDINADSTYLKNNYPLEMWQMRNWFPNKLIVGFDWLGKDLEGKAIPGGYWQTQSVIKQLQRELNNDNLISSQLESCYTEQAVRDSLLKNLSLSDLLKSRDAEITTKQYACLRKVVKGTKYEALPDFYDERNEKILENINEIINQNSGKKIVILTGDDHYIALKGKFPHH